MTSHIMLDVVARALAEGYQGRLYGLEGSDARGPYVVVASCEPASGLACVGSTRRGSEGGVVRDEGGGWRYVLPGAGSARLTVVPWTHDYAARHAGLLDAATLASKHALLVGDGSIGCPIAIGLGRAGLGRITLVDADTVGLENLCRSGFFARQLGVPKVEATRELLLDANPRLEVRCVARTWADALEREPDIDQDVDLVIAAASNAVGFDLAARFHRRVPVLFPALHARAASGEIFLSGGAATADRACFGCFRAHMPSVGTARTWNYSGEPGELAAEPGLGADIAHVVAIATSVAVRALAAADGDGMDLSRGELLLVANRAGAVLDAPYEARWVRVPRHPACTNHEERGPADQALLSSLCDAIPEIDP